MARTDRHQGKPPRPARRRQPKGNRAGTRRFCSDSDFRGRIEIHTSESAEADTALVYIFRDATGLSKIGFSQSLKSRVAMVHSTLPLRHRPVRLVRAIMVQRDLAYKIERFAHHLLSAKQVRGIFTGCGEVREWYSVPPNVASRYLNIALAAVQKTANELGHTQFYWRKALP